ncbi:hypothetical protein C8J56DRAFT_887078 [Mycena floridula]|nr:hypothetical protein C8J56DRAFT_887078 [Mycena floridula]
MAGWQILGQAIEMIIGAGHLENYWSNRLSEGRSKIYLKCWVNFGLRFEKRGAKIMILKVRSEDSHHTMSGSPSHKLESAWNVGGDSTNSDLQNFKGSVQRYFAYHTYMLGMTTLRYAGISSIRIQICYAGNNHIKVMCTVFDGKMAQDFLQRPRGDPVPAGITVGIPGGGSGGSIRRPSDSRLFLQAVILRITFQILKFDYLLPRAADDPRVIRAMP